MTKKILLLVATTAVMVLMLAPVAWADSHTDRDRQMMQGGGGDRQMMQGGGGSRLPASGGLPILPIVGAAAATLVLAGGGVAYRRRRR